MANRGGLEAAALSGGTALAIFFATLLPTVPFGDGGELIAVSDSLGTAHPPGYPWYTILLKLALSLPVGEPAARANAVSALMGGVACALLSVLVHRATASTVAAVAGGIALAGTKTFWTASTATEVYSTHVALLLGLLLCAQVCGLASSRTARGRALIGGGVLLGLGLAHHPTIVLVLPGAAVLAARQRRGTIPVTVPVVTLRSVVISCAAAAGIPALAYLSLLLRASAPTTWARLQDLEALLAHLTARDFQHLDAGWAALTSRDSWAHIGEVSWTELTPAGAMLAVLGAVVGLHPRLASAPTCRLTASAVLLFVSNGLFGMRYVVNDWQPFFLPCVVALSLLAATACAAILRTPYTVVRFGGGVIIVAFGVLPFLIHLPLIAPRDDVAPRLYAEDVLSTLPRHAALIVAGDEAFPLAYVHRVLHHRPDVTIFDRNGRLFRDMAADLGIVRLPGESRGAWRLRAEIDWLSVVVMARPEPDVYFLGSPGYEIVAPYQLEPVGMLTRFRRPAQPLRNTDAVERHYREDAVLRHAERTQAPAALSSAVSYGIGRGARALFEGDRVRAAVELEKASRRASSVASIQAFIGGMWLSAGDLDRAISMYRLAVHMQPTSIPAWHDLSLALEAAGRFDEARDARARSLALQRFQIGR